MKIAHTTTKLRRESLSNCCKYCTQLHGCTQIQRLARPVGACACTFNSTIECYTWKVPVLFALYNYMQLLVAH